MDCSGCRTRISLHIDSALPQEEQDALRDHLEVCDSCRTEWEELLKTREHLRNLDQVESPPWLTQRIMAKIREEAPPKKSIWQRLFYPLHIKIPLEAAASILIAVLVFSLHEKDDDLKHYAVTRPAPSQQEAAPPEAVPEKPKEEVPLVRQKKDAQMPVRDAADGPGEKAARRPYVAPAPKPAAVEEKLKEETAGRSMTGPPSSASPAESPGIMKAPAAPAPAVPAKPAPEREETSLYAGKESRRIEQAATSKERMQDEAMSGRIADRNRYLEIRRLIQETLRQSEGFTPPSDAQAVASVRREVAESDIPVLIRLLGDEEPQIAAAAQHVLESFGPTALPALKDAVNSPNHRIGDRARAAIDRITSKKNPQ